MAFVAMVSTLIGLGVSTTIAKDLDWMGFGGASTVVYAVKYMTETAGEMRLELNAVQADFKGTTVYQN